MRYTLSGLLSHKKNIFISSCLLVVALEASAQNSSYNGNSIPINGFNNAAFGYQSLFSATSSTTNSAALGYRSLYSNTTGFFNSALGYRSLYSNTSGTTNAAFGSESLFTNTTGSYNLGLGWQSLYSNTTGFGNVGVGTQSLYSNTGEYNTAVGQTALMGNTTGGNNTGIGKSTLFSNSTGSNNVSIGVQALFNNSSGFGNVGIGAYAFNTNTIGYYNTVIGAYSDVGANNLDNATAIGFAAIVNNSNSIQLGNGSVTTIYAGVGTSAKLITGNLQVTSGSPGVGKVLTSDGIGNATWQTPGGGTGGGNDWTLLGNTGTVDGTNFIGTTDNVPFNIRVNNQKAGRIDQVLLNTFFGMNAGNNITTGYSNAAFGHMALSSNTSGSSNVAIGLNALANNTTGTQNIAIGTGALSSNTFAASNIAIGVGALMNNVSGFYNTAFGQSTLGTNTSGGFNSAFGLSSLYLNTTGSYNTANGLYSLVSNTSGSHNTTDGYNSLYTNTTGSNNSALGANADVGSSNLTNATVIGYGAIVNASNSIQLGNSSVTAVYAGTGTNAKLITGGLQVTWGLPGVGKVLTSDAFGNATWQTPSGGTGGSGWSLTGNAGTVDGTNFIGTTDFVAFNIRVNGQRSGRIEPDVNYGNTYFGLLSGNNVSPFSAGQYQTAFGVQTLQYNDQGHYNTAVGAHALQFNTHGADNVAVGVDALKLHTTGSQNSAVGNFALRQSNGGFNTAMGYRAMANDRGGIRNTAVGHEALFNSNGSYNTALGKNADVISGVPVSFSTALGYNAIMNTSDKVRIGSVGVTTIEGQVAYSWPSDGRFKTDVTETVSGLDFILKLRPVVYNFDTRSFQEFLVQSMPDSLKARYFDGINFEPSTAIRHSGFIAQEVQAAATEAGYDFDGVHAPSSEFDNYSLAYGQFVVPLVKSVQELSKQNKEMQKTINEQQQINLSLKKEIDDLKSLVRTNMTENKTGTIQISSETASAQLFQNAPNPFNRSTTIKYSIPADTKTAMITIKTLNGIKVAEYELVNKGGQSIEITGGKLSAGTYVYSLIVEGKLIDSKKMILTH